MTCITVAALRGGWVSSRWSWTSSIQPQSKLWVTLNLQWPPPPDNSPEPGLQNHSFGFRYERKTMQSTSVCLRVTETHKQKPVMPLCLIWITFTNESPHRQPVRATLWNWLLQKNYQVTPSQCGILFDISWWETKQDAFLGNKMSS